MTSKQLEEWLEQNYFPVIAFAMIEKKELCTVLFPLDFVRDVSSWYLADCIGRVIAQELQLCRAKFKEFYKV